MIGVIDSGVGGLSVLKELRQAMPQADFFYLAIPRAIPTAHDRRRKLKSTHCSWVNGCWHMELRGWW